MFEVTTDPNEKTKTAVGVTVIRLLLTAAGLALVFESIGAASLTNTLHLGIIMPLVIGLPLAIVGIFWPLFSRLCARFRIARILRTAMIAVYALFFLLFAFTTTAILVNAAEPADKKPDTLIVLGAGIRGDHPTATLAYRLEKALECYEKDPELTIIVSGGKGSDEAYTEAEVMKAWLVRCGVPEENIIEEGRSESTEENFLFSREIIAAMPDKGEGESTVAFVTSRFHVFRAERIAKKLGLDTYGIPARQYKPLILNEYMRECAAIVQYFFTGRM